jgi:hypothetical protein
MNAAPIKQRLLNGAKVLGGLWNSGIRCQVKWRKCECAGEQRTKFCEGKKQWLDLARKADPPRVPGGGGDSPTLVLDLMTTAELDAATVTMKVDIPDVGEISVGSKGEISFTALQKVGPDAIRAVVMILRKFPGAKVIG